MIRTGEWMQTYSGRLFWPLDPSPDEIDIGDIAHALSQLCRYNGHSERFYCPMPEERVLTADLRWVPAGDLRVGDELLAFDETPTEKGSAETLRRRFRHGHVLTAAPVKRRVIRLEMADGSTVRASEEHPWLIATKASRNQTWRSAGAIRADINNGKRRYMHRFFPTWTFTDSWKVGWLAGLYDGEGYLSIRNRRGVQLGVAQNTGLVLEQAVSVLSDLGFSSLRYAQTGNTGKVITLQMNGGWREVARLLGSVRPGRLLNKFTIALRTGEFSKQMDGQSTPLEIVRAYDEGDQWVAGLETSTRTFLCEGFGAHNSVAEHSWHLWFIVHSWYPQDYTQQLMALLHDASEAYLADVPRPVKPYLTNYASVEERVEKAIAHHFGLPGWGSGASPLIRELNTRIVVDEATNLMKPWPELARLGTKLGVPIYAWEPLRAKDEFLAAFHRTERGRKAQTRQPATR